MSIQQSNGQRRCLHKRQGALPAGQGACGDHRRRQLRLGVRTGRALLQRRRPEPARARADARGPRRLPHQRHRIHCRLRHRRHQGRQGPRAGDLGRAEQHDEVRQGAEEAWRARVPRHDPRRPRQVPQAEDQKGSRRDRRHRQHPQGDAHRRGRLLPARRQRGRDQVVRRADPRGRLRLRELHPRVHRSRGLLGQALQEGETADRRRRHQVAGRARRSCTARSRACSPTAA